MSQMDEHAWSQFLTAVRREIPSWERFASEALRSLRSYRAPSPPETPAADYANEALCDRPECTLPAPCRVHSPAPETPAREGGADARIRCGACGKLAEGECSCPKETPGYYHPNPAVDAEIREEVKRRDEWDSAHGIRVGWHKRPASPASATSRGTDHDPATKEQS